MSYTKEREREGKCRRKDILRVLYHQTVHLQLTDKLRRYAYFYLYKTNIPHSSFSPCLITFSTFPSNRPHEELSIYFYYSAFLCNSFLVCWTWSGEDIKGTSYAWFSKRNFLEIDIHRQRINRSNHCQLIACVLDKRCVGGDGTWEGFVFPFNTWYVLPVLPRTS